MGYSEDWKPCNCKIEEPAEDQNPDHAYPDWPMMQAYNGPHFTVPTVAFPPPYMLVVPVPPQPQYMQLPYLTYYAHEAGVYGHPGLGVSMGFSTAESTGNMEGGNGNADSGEHGRLSESDQVQVTEEDSSDGVNGVKAEEEVDTGKLATIVETLIGENMRLKSEIDKFTEISKKLELENAILMETINDARPGDGDCCKKWFHGEKR